MKKIESIENTNTWGDFLWVHFRGFLFIALMACAIFVSLNMAMHYSIEINKSDIESLKYCPHCGQDLLR